MNTKVYFQEDEPKDNLRNDDAFGHMYYARSLFQILEKTNTSRSYAIGLFGKWGVGKTSIINELKQIITENQGLKIGRKSFNHNYKIIQLDAWQYSEQNFRREFLLDVASNFDAQKEIKDILTIKTRIETKEPPKLNRAWTGRLAIQLVLLIALLGLSLFIPWISVTYSVQLGQAATVLSQILVVIVGTAVVLQENIQGLFKFQPIIYETEPPIHPDQFKDIFCHLLQKADLSKPNNRLVIVLDNLDRVKEEVVLQILAAVKTFLKEDKCIYILPCDEKGLKQHIINMRSVSNSNAPFTESQSAEFLRKFFQTTLTIRDILSEDLDSFIDTVLERMEIFDLSCDVGKNKSTIDAASKDLINKNRNEVALVMRVAIARNPRRIIQLANKLSANFLLAEEKGKVDTSLKNIICSNLGFLAKVTVIEEEWPHFYSLILYYPDLMRELKSYFYTESDSGLPSVIAKEIKSADESPIRDEWEHGLKDFLRRTSTINSDYVSNFTQFKQRQIIPQIANYYVFYDAANMGDFETVNNVLQSSSTNVDLAVNELIKEVDRRVALSDIPTATNLVRCLVKGFQVISEDRLSTRQRIADAVAKTVSMQQFVANLLVLGLDEVLSVLSITQSKENLRETINNIITLINFDGESVETKVILEQLGKYHQLQVVDNRNRLRRKIGGKANGQCLVELRSFAKASLANSTEYTRDAIPQSFYAENIKFLETVNPNADIALDFLTSFFVFIDANGASQYADIIEKQFSSVSNQPNKENLFGLKCINSAPSEFIPANRRENIISKLVSAYNQFANVEQKFQVVESFLHLLPSLKVKEQAGFEACLLGFIDQSSPDQLIVLMDAVRECLATIVSLEKLLKRIQDRVQAHFSNRLVRQTFFRLADAADLHNAIQDLLQKTGTQLDQSQAALSEAKVYLSQEEFSATVLNLMEKYDGIGEGLFERALTHLSNYRDYYTDSFYKNLTEELFNDWFKKPSVSARKGALLLWKSIRDRAVNSQDILHGRLIEQAGWSVSDNSVVQPVNKIIIEVLLYDQDLLSESNCEGLTNLGLQMTERARPLQVQLFGYETLGKLSNATYAQEKVPSELIDDLEQETNPDLIRANLNLLKLFEAHISRTSKSKLKKILKNRSSESIIQEFQNKF